VGYNNTPNVIVQIDNKAIREQQEKADRQTQVINQGTSLITADQTTPLDIQVEGRTLVPLQNSNLESGGTYVLANADKKSKVVVDNKPVSGVAKFTKNNMLTRKAGLFGKITGSTVENPNFYKTTSGQTTVNTQLDPNAAQLLDRGESAVGLLNNVLHTTSTNINNAFSQATFSFDLVAEIERNMGRIPGADLAAKIQWIKDNVATLKGTWYGYGTGKNGYRANFSVFVVVGNPNNSWDSIPQTHTASVVTALTRSMATGALNVIDANGFVHFMAYAEPSDGTAASAITSDFIEMEFTLKSTLTAPLDTRPQVVRTANFEGKVTGSTAEVPHIAKANAIASTLTAPNGAWSEFSNNASGSYTYNRLNALDGLTTSLGPADQTAGKMNQMLFSFDLIAEVERNIGRIPAATVSGKVQWLKDNINKTTFNWYGYGSHPGGNKATITVWSNYSGGIWDSALRSSHTLGTVQKLTQAPGSSYNNFIIQSDGFVHFVANSEAQDATTPSAIFMDYVELEIEIKPGAALHDPQVPLYQVDSTEYANILGAWPEAEVLTRYPKTTGIQHVQNPYIMAEGENLLPPLYEWDDSSSGKATILEPYKVKLTQAVAGQRMTIYIPAVEGQTYTYSGNKDTANGLIYFYFCDEKKTRLQGSITHTSGTAPAGTKLMEVILNPDAPMADYIFSNPMMTLGSVPKPFVPKNPSYLFAQVKLGQIGSIKDVLYKQDGWKVRKAIEKDVILDGSWVWNPSLQIADTPDYKRAYISAINITNAKAGAGVMTAPDGEVIPFASSFKNNSKVYDNAMSGLFINVPNVVMGVPSPYSPTSAEFAAVFNGWQAKTVDVNGKPTSWRSLGDGTDAPTQTLAYVQANKAPNFTPYKFTYQLVTPVIEDVSDKVEGDISVAGITQVEVGSGVVVREKVTPVIGGGNAFINQSPSNKLKTRNAKILSVFKNGVSDNSSWGILSFSGGPSPLYGAQYLATKDTSADAAAEYKVTYLVLERDKFTVNPFNLRATYAKNIRSALEDTVKKVEDNTKDISVNVGAIAELYKRMKSMGG